MAGVWEVRIQVIKFSERTVMVYATRTDDSVQPPDVRNYSAEGKYDTETQTRQELLAMYKGIFWDLYQREIAKEGEIPALVRQAEIALAAALQEMEDA